MQYLSGTPSVRIKEKIKETGIKQIHLAKKIGISPQHLHKILKNQEGSQYLPKIAEILGMDESWLETGNIRSIQILTEDDIKSLSDGSVLFDELSRVILKFWPSVIQKDYYIFGYELTENISTQFLKNDLLIFSSCLPLDMTGKIGLAYIQKKSIVFTGKIKYNHKALIIYNEHDCFKITSGDLLFGIAIYLERNMGDI
jgi:transcriptional regulator with XRE-family HTH domain